MKPFNSGFSNTVEASVGRRASCRVPTDDVLWNYLNQRVFWMKCGFVRWDEWAVLEYRPSGVAQLLLLPRALGNTVVAKETEYFFGSKKHSADHRFERRNPRKSFSLFTLEFLFHHTLGIRLHSTRDDSVNSAKNPLEGTRCRGSLDAHTQ